MIGSDGPMVESAAGCGSIARPTLTDRLTERRTRLTAELEKLDTVLAALADNPETQGILDAISELGGF